MIDSSLGKQVLVVDDSDDRRVTTKWFLGSCGYSVTTARNAEEALQLFDPESCDAVVTDNVMPGMSGVALSGIVKRRSPSTPVLMYTATPPADLSSIDFLLHRPAHILQLKDALDALTHTDSSWVPVVI